MILTCPRCATRYLIDEHRVWSTGRTVKCDACGQTWRAVGAGLRPPRPEPPKPPPTPSAELTPEEPPAEPTPEENAAAVAAVEIVVEGDDEPVTPRGFQSLESEPGFVPPPEAPKAPDPPESAPEAETGGETTGAPVIPSSPPSAQPLFAPPRSSVAKRKAGSGADRGLSVGLVLGWALGLLILILLVEAVANRVAIVRANPQLAAVYRAIGLPVDTAPAESVGRTH